MLYLRVFHRNQINALMKVILSFFLLFTFSIHLNAQQYNKKFTLSDVIRIAREQSPQAILAKHRFRSSYWEYRTYVARFRPSLSLSGEIVDYNKSFEREFDNNEEIFVPKHLNNTLMNLSVDQNIGITGGRLFVNSILNRFDVLGEDGYTQYITTPVRIGYRQSMIKYNDLRWERKIEPLKYQEAQKEYIERLEGVSVQAVQRFFDLILAQINLELAQLNYSNSDTLFKIAQGRFNIGTIAENELLQMELSFLNAGIELNRAKVNLEMGKYRLRSFLGYNENVDITLTIPKDIPNLEIEVAKALAEAKSNNPEIIHLERQIIQAQSNVAQAKADKGVNAEIFASYGLTQRAPDIPGAYKDPLDQQGLRIGINLPIIDWGLGRGRYRMAQSSMEVVRTNVQQAQIDFEQEIFLVTMQFNLQDDQVRAAAKADTIANSRYDVTKARFLIGKIDVLDLNVAQTEKDQARRGYVSALREYWDYFYTIRRYTLYDFIEDESLKQNFEDIVK